MVLETIKGWHKARKCLGGTSSTSWPNEAFTTKTMILLKKKWTATPWEKMKNLNRNKITASITATVPGESISNLVSREYESYLPERITGTNSFFMLFSLRRSLLYPESSCSANWKQLHTLCKILPQQFLQFPWHLEYHSTWICAFDGVL